MGRTATEAGFVYGMPRWAALALALLFLLLAAASFFAFVHWNEGNPASRSFLKWPVLAISAGFLWAAAKSGMRRSWVYFRADRDGLWFPSEVPSTDKTSWLFVPWERVGEIRKARLYDRSDGLSLELSLNDDEIDRYFRDVRLTQMLLGGEPGEHGAFVVGYSNLFMNPGRVVTRLQRLQAARNRAHSG